MTTPKTNCAIKPTVRSEKARLRNNVFKLVGIDEAFHRALIARRFPSVARTENVKFKAQNVDNKVL